MILSLLAGSGQGTLHWTHYATGQKMPCFFHGVWVKPWLALISIKLLIPIWWWSEKQNERRRYLNSGNLCCKTNLCVIYGIKDSFPFTFAVVPLGWCRQGGVKESTGDFICELSNNHAPQINDIPGITYQPLLKNNRGTNSDTHTHKHPIPCYYTICYSRVWANSQCCWSLKTTSSTMSYLLKFNQNNR